MIEGGCPKPRHHRWRIGLLQTAAPMAIRRTSVRLVALLRSVFWAEMAPTRHHLARLKYCTARSWFSAAARVAKVPRFRRRPLRGFFFREYKRYWPDLSLRIMVSVLLGALVRCSTGVFRLDERQDEPSSINWFETQRFLANWLCKNYQTPAHPLVDKVPFIVFSFLGRCDDPMPRKERKKWGLGLSHD